jgi:2-phosphosulfolactate phosphatase
MNQLAFEVAFLPQEVRAVPAPVCVVIDVLRASSTIVTLLEKGCSEIVLTSDVEQTLAGHPDYRTDGTFVCAEDEAGNVAEHADFSPSLAAIHKREIRGKRVILRTTNGTVAAQTLWNVGVEHVLIGCMHNAEAVMYEAVRLARRLNKDVTIACAGRENGRITALDDVYTAGVLLQYGKKAAEEFGVKPVLRDSAKIAMHLNAAYADTMEAFADSGSGETMRRIQCVEDMAICAKRNVSTLTPMLMAHEKNGNLLVKNANEVILQ